MFPILQDNRRTNSAATSWGPTEEEAAGDRSNKDRGSRTDDSWKKPGGSWRDRQGDDGRRGRRRDWDNPRNDEDDVEDSPPRSGLRSTIVSVVRRKDSQSAPSPEESSPPNRTRSTIQVVAPSGDAAPDERKVEVHDEGSREARSRDASDRRKKNSSKSPERKESDEKSPKKKRR